MDLLEDEDDRIDGPLRALFELAEEKIDQNSSFWSVDCQMGMLGFARQCARVLK